MHIYEHIFIKYSKILGILTFWFKPQIQFCSNVYPCRLHHHHHYYSHYFFHKDNEKDIIIIYYYFIGNMTWICNLTIAIVSTFSSCATGSCKKDIIHPTIFFFSLQMRKNTHNLFQQYNVPLTCDDQEISPSSEVNFIFPLFMIETRVNTLPSPSSSTVNKLLSSTTAKRRGKLAWVKIIHRDFVWLYIGYDRFIFSTSFL